MATSDITNRTVHAAKTTAAVLARALPADCCYGVQSVPGQKDGFMPLVDGDDLVTDSAKAASVCAVLAMVHVDSLYCPALVIVPKCRANAWLGR